MKKKLRVLLVTPYDFAHIGGVQEHIQNFASHLIRKGHDAFIAAPLSKNTMFTHSAFKSITHRVISLPFNKSYGYVGIPIVSRTRIKDILQETSFDIVHLHEPIIPTISPDVLRYSNAINVGTFHSNGENNIFLRIGKPFYKYLNRLQGRIAVSETSYGFIDSYFPGNYRIIPNGIEFERFANPNILAFPKFVDGKFNIIFVGRLDQRKGFRYLLEAFRLVQQHHKIRLIVIGDFNSVETVIYQQYIRKHKLRDIEFIGYVTPEELPKWYRTAHMLCAPALGYESFGLILLEAMAAGLPIVASDINGYRCVITRDVQGNLVPPANVNALAAAISNLACSPELCKKLGLAGQEQASKYTWDKVTRSILNYYYELL